MTGVVLMTQHDNDPKLNAHCGDNHADYFYPLYTVGMITLFSHLTIELYIVSSSSILLRNSYCGMGQTFAQSAFWLDNLSDCFHKVECIDLEEILVGDC